MDIVPMKALSEANTTLPLTLEEYVYKLLDNSYAIKNELLCLYV